MTPCSHGANFSGRFMTNRGQRGQITIFFAIVVVVMITMIAFIINIGIFVKAKINLQNATDAAAYAGASVQARQLTSIAYLNWEMRNTYKEWMFKYYVLGGLNLKGVTGTTPPNCPSTLTSSGGMDFTMCPYQTGNRPVQDSYNFPSICIDFAGTGSVGLCTRMLVPGLPRFASSNVLGLDETTNAFIDTIVAQKGLDCTRRSELNFLTANTWAYNVPDGVDSKLINIRDFAPEIAANRVGAFPKAFELALRIRNLEFQMNKAPYQAVCMQAGNSPNCQVGIGDLTSRDQSPSTERIYKAFFSGFRNLGSDEDAELRRTFTLTEISPQTFRDPGTFSLSNLLIPENNRDKRYIDLKLMPVNFATFYTAFTAGNGNYSIGGSVGNTPSEGECTATKMGLPVPGYPMGFVKNPDALTYYAVKAEAQFIGLFNPFDNIPIKLTAYSAAKPFGGRIGPALFDTSDSLQIKPRGQDADGANLRKSSPFMLTLDTAMMVDSFGGNLPPGEYRPGVPLPLNQTTSQFWTPPNGSQVVGGFVGSGQAITFGIPNMIYEYPDISNVAGNSSYYAQGGNLLQNVSGQFKGDITAGLYNKQMFNKLKSKLVGIGGAVTTQNIENGISMARAPTLYEAHNYLIPTPENLNAQLKTDSFGPITDRDLDQSANLRDSENNAYTRYRFNIYAPLFAAGSSALYSEASNVNGVLTDYLRSQQPAIQKYVESMSLAAQKIYQSTVSSNTNQDLGIEAARGISDIGDGILKSGSPNDVVGLFPSCNSIAGQFAYYYLGGDSGVAADGCPTPFKEILISRWSVTNFPDNYELEYAVSPTLGRELFSAYQPGEEHDALGGVQNSALGGNPDVMIRNSYSTKFVSLSSLVPQTEDSYSKNLTIMSEGKINATGGPTAQKGFKNPLQSDTVNLDLGKVRY